MTQRRESPDLARVADVRALAHAIDPARAARSAGRIAGDDEGAALAVLLATAYPAIAAALEADAGPVRSIAAEGYRVARDRAGLLARIRERSGDLGNPDIALAALRRATREERLRIALRELLPAALGGADVDVTAGELAALADATLEVALGEAFLSVTRRLGEPRTTDGAAARLVILGMGKLGGGELNAGSDVDLIFLYDTDDGESVSPTGERTSLHDVWTRIARRVTSTLEDATADGQLWRVDLRLRPEGRTGPLVNSLAAAERYYESFGRLWERAALLRARPSAGDLGFGEEALAALSSFVWRKRVDPALAIEMISLAQRSRLELSSDPARDLKLGAGGIREAEFFVQSLQLIWGGREPRVRVRNTLDALRRLRASGLVTDREGREIAEAYLALRRAEHAVQVASGLQTHSLPTDRAELGILARSLGFPGAEAFEADLAVHQARVASRFASLVPGGAPPISRWAEALVALEQGELGALAHALVRAGAVGDEPSSRPAEGPLQGEEMAHDLLELTRHPDAPFGARTRATFPSLAETVLDAVVDAADPAQAARFLRLFFGRVRHSGVYAKLLGDDPRAVRRLVATLGASAFIAQAVANHPDLGNLVLFSGGAVGPDAARDEVRTQLASLPPGDEEDEESVAGALRRAKARVTVEVGLADLAGELTTREATQALSGLADATLEAAARHALGVAADAPVRGLAVLAMGKLGGRDLGYGSDLDVIFLFDPAAAPPGKDAAEHFARAARRVIRLIPISHAAGPGYELDTRLRPSGSQGLLVTSLEAFARYHREGRPASVPPRSASPSASERADDPTPRAATWERLALLRARAAAGDPELGAQAIAIAHATAYGRGGDARELAREIHPLRARMERELSHERAGRYDIKLGRGGLTDVEFSVQLLQMAHGADPRVRTTETSVAIEALAAAGYLAPAHAEALRDGYAFLRRLEQRVRIVHADASHLLEEAAPGVALLARRLGIRDRPRAQAAAELVARYREVTGRVRAAYDAIMDPP